MPQKTLAVANFFVERGSAEGIPIDPLKLQKLVYFGHGWHLAVTGEPLIDECIEAWPYGPVVPTIYHEFKRYGYSPITSPATEFVLREDVAPARTVVLSDGYWTTPRVTDSRALTVLEKVWREYGKFSGVYLSNISHTAGSPWDVAWKKAKAGGKVRGADIPDHEMRQYFYAAGLRERSRR